MFAETPEKRAYAEKIKKAVKLEFFELVGEQHTADRQYEVAGVLKAAEREHIFFLRQFAGEKDQPCEEPDCHHCDSRQRQNRPDAKLGGMKLLYYVGKDKTGQQESNGYSGHRLDMVVGDYAPADEKAGGKSHYEYLKHCIKGAEERLCKGFHHCDFSKYRLLKFSFVDIILYTCFLQETKGDF